MTLATDCATDDTQMLPLFTHATRKEWGVGVLAWELGGKRGYLFDDGEERTMASGFYELMGKVEQPSPDQRAACARLQRVLAGRASARHLAIETNGPSFYDQVARLRKTYPAGLTDARWAQDIRGEGAKTRSARHRAILVSEAQEQLGVAALDNLLASQRYSQVWEIIVALLNRTDLVPKSQIKQSKTARGEQQRELALSLRELLHGTGPYEKRFDRFSSALAAHSGEPTKWEVATALPAIVHPTEHVCVHPTPFRLQFKVIGAPGTPPAAKPSGAGYMRVLAATRNVSTKLAEQGEVLRDLLDVHDFIRITLKPAAKVRLKSPKPSSRSEPAASSEAADTEDSDDDSAE